MLNQIIKTNATEVTYQLLNEEGKLLNKKQSFNYMSYDATEEDFFELGNAIGNILAYATKDILKNTVTLLVEA